MRATFLLGQANPWVVLAVLSLVVLPIGIDLTVLNVALPRLTAELGASNADKLWMINAYSLVMAGLLPGFGTLSDKVGHRNMLLSGLGLFAMVSLALAFAPSSGIFIALRGALAVGAAMILPASISIVRLVFEEERQRATAIGIWGGVWSGSAMLGPIMGGLLLSRFWWGAVFLINVPIVVFAILLTWSKIPDLPANKHKSWDLLASLYLSACLVGLLYALKGMFREDLPVSHVAAALIAGLVFCRLFLRRQALLPAPLLDFSLFWNIRFSAGVSIAVFSSFALVGLQYSVSQELQLVRGLSPLSAGFYLLPIALASVFSGLGAGRIMIGVGMERMMVITCAFGALGTSLFRFGGHLSGSGMELAVLALIGLSAGGAMAVASTAIMISAPNDKAGMAGAIEAIAYELGGTLGVAVMGSVMGHVYRSDLAVAPSSSLFQSAISSMEGAIQAAGRLSPEAGRDLLAVAKAAYLGGVDASLTLAAGIMTLLFVTMIVMVYCVSRLPSAHR